MLVSFLLLKSLILKILKAKQKNINVIIEIITKYIKSKIFCIKFDTETKSKNKIAYSIPCIVFNDMKKTKKNFNNLLKN